MASKQTQNGGSAPRTAYRHWSIGRDHTVGAFSDTQAKGGCPWNDPPDREDSVARIKVLGVDIKRDKLVFEHSELRSNFRKGRSFVPESGDFDLFDAATGVRVLIGVSDRAIKAFIRREKLKAGEYWTEDTMR
jgi:hypothetical protein